MFADESSTSTVMDRPYSRTPGGVRVDDPVPPGYGKVITLTSAVHLDGVSPVACPPFDDATNFTCFGTCEEQCRMPALRPGCVVILSNISSHETAAVTRDALGRDGRPFPGGVPPRVQHDRASFRRAQVCAGIGGGAGRRGGDSGGGRGASGSSGRHPGAGSAIVEIRQTG